MTCVRGIASSARLKTPVLTPQSKLIHLRSPHLICAVRQIHGRNQGAVSSTMEETVG